MNYVVYMTLPNAIATNASMMEVIDRTVKEDANDHDFAVASGPIAEPSETIGHRLVAWDLQPKSKRPQSGIDAPPRAVI